VARWRLQQTEPPARAPVRTSRQVMESVSNAYAYSLDDWLDNDPQCDYLSQIERHYAAT
jgi:hypothetical protein